MTKLALAAGRGSELAEGRAVIAVDQRAADAAYAQLGQSVLVYLHVKGVVLQFVGMGRVASVGLAASAGRSLVLEPYNAFAVPVPGDPERNAPGARRLVQLDDQRFEDILSQSGSSPGIAIDEAATDFVSTPDPATHAAIREQVLRAWRHRCCFTGTAESAELQLSIVAIKPREQGGPLHVGNYIPVVAGLEAAWRAGHFGVGDDHRVLGDLYRLAPEDQDSMVALFKMLLPDDARAYPDPQLLAWHRQNVFGRS